jgi:hypothetical protein
MKQTVKKKNCVRCASNYAFNVERFGSEPDSLNEMNSTGDGNITALLSSGYDKTHVTLLTKEHAKLYSPLSYGSHSNEHQCPT